MPDAIACAHSVDGSGPALIMIHGIGARRQAWDRLTEILKHDFTCIRYDLRGHGDSPLPEAAFDLDDLIADLEALRAKLGIERAHVIGHSLGGMIGPVYARSHPDRVLSLGLLSTAAFRTAEDSRKVNAVVAAMEEKGIEPVLATLVDRWFTEDFAQAHPEVIAWRIKQVLDTDPAVFLNVFRIYAGTEMGPSLHEIEHPALVVTGELDGGCNPRLNRQIAEAMPNAELVILDGLKHAILIEASDRVAAPLKAFLNRRATSGRFSQEGG